MTFFDIFENFLEQRPRSKTEVAQVVPGNEPGRADLLRRSFANKALDEFVSVQLAMAAGAVQPVQLEVLIEIDDGVPLDRVRRVTSAAM